MLKPTDFKNYDEDIKSENSGGNHAAFIYYRYRVAPVPSNLDIMESFERKVKNIIDAKNEMKVINKELIQKSKIIRGSATDLSNIPNESVDYIYTDPPYGNKIPYLDLSIMWNSWLDLEVTDTDYDNEAIEGGKQQKTKDEYGNLIALSIKEMFRVLKFNRWMSFVFAHKDPKYWHIIINSAEKVGFEYAGCIKQKNGNTSFKKYQNPFTVLSGQLIINFKKVPNPKSIMKLLLGINITEVITETIESIIAKNHGATIEEINDELIIRGLELGFLDVLSKEYDDLTPLLMKDFEYDEEKEKYFIKKNTKFKTKPEFRIKYFLLSYLRRLDIQNIYPTFDEIILEIMPLLKNGDTPAEQTILKELENLAYRTDNGMWKLKECKDTLFD
jgi:hypothetical protein